MLYSVFSSTCPVIHRSASPPNPNICTTTNLRFDSSISLQIASLLLHHASDDLVNPGMLRRCVEDLSNIRDSKMRKWMQENVRDRVNAIKVNNLTLHEISVHRPILTRVLDNLYNIHVAPDTRGLSSTDSTNPSSDTTGASDARPAQSRQLRRVIRKT